MVSNSITSFCKKLLHSAKNVLLASAGGMYLYVPNPIPVTEGIGQTLHKYVGTYDYCSMVIIAPTWAITARHCGININAFFTPGFGREEGNGLGVPKPPNYPTYSIQQIVREPTGADIELIQFSPPVTDWVSIAPTDISIGNVAYFAAQGFGNSEYTAPHIIRVGTSAMLEVSRFTFWAGWSVNPDNPHQPTLHEASTVLHDSGGGMFTINPLTTRLELHGVITGGGYNINSYGAISGVNLIYYKDWISGMTHPSKSIGHIDTPNDGTPVAPSVKNSGSLHPCRDC